MKEDQDEDEGKEESEGDDEGDKEGEGEEECGEEGERKLRVVTWGVYVCVIRGHYRVTHHRVTVHILYTFSGLYRAMLSQ